MSQPAYLSTPLPSWLKGVFAAELALALVTFELLVVAAPFVDVGQLPVVALVLRAAVVVVPFGALVGAVSPWVRERRALRLWSLTLAMFATAGALFLFTLRGTRMLALSALEVGLGTLVLALPVGIAALVFVRWTREPPPLLDLASLVDTFE